jgi:DnaJ-domain-containing protein 1
VKSHYQLLGIEPGADVESIKKAFRREIARYHPDKVIHLGAEFQQMASVKAAELTKAYTTLSNPQMRAAYDASLTGGGPVPAQRADSAPAPAQPAAAASSSPHHDTARSPGAATDPRAEIVRRAALGRLRGALQTAVPDATFASVSGFDLACLSRAKSSLFRRATLPSVLVRLAATVDKDVVNEAYASAIKAKLEQKPIVLLLAGDRLAPTGELAQAIEEQRRRNPALSETLVPVPVDIRDWAAKIPANAPASVKPLIDALKNFAG